MVEVDESADGRAIELPLHGQLKISLPENPTTGFHWVVDDIAETICDLADDTFESTTTARGSGGVHQWRLKARQKGTGKIALRYRRPWETKPPLKSFTVTVRVN